MAPKLYSLYLRALDAAAHQKTKAGCFQGYHQTEITHRREENETLPVTTLSFYLCQEVAGSIPNFC